MTMENLLPGVKKLESLSASVTHLDRYPYMCYVGTMGKGLFILVYAVLRLCSIIDSQYYFQTQWPYFVMFRPHEG